MYEYFKNPLKGLSYFKLKEDGKLYELDIVTGMWNDITEFEEFSPVWEACEEKEIDYFRLFIYVQQSSNYFAEHSHEVGITDYKYGDNFDFYITDDGVYAIDEENNGYKCDSRLMVPTMSKIMEVEPDWAELSLEDAITYIENQNGIFLSNMELYYDDNGNVQGFTKDLKQFCLNLKTGELNEVYDNVGIDENWKPCSISDPVFDDDNNEILLTVDQYEQMENLHNYLNLTNDYGRSFKYYERPFGDIYALDEDENTYFCSKQGLQQTEKKVEIDGCIRISRFEVPGKVEEYNTHLEELFTKEIKVQDLVCFSSPFGEVNGITEDGRKYLLSDETGELEQIEREDLLKNSWHFISVTEAMKIQAIFKGRVEYKTYIEYFRERIAADGITEPDSQFEFFLEDLGQNDVGDKAYNVYAIDELYNEYKCTSDSMEMADEGTIKGVWRKLEDFRVMGYLNNL